MEMQPISGSLGIFGTSSPTCRCRLRAARRWPPNCVRCSNSTRAGERPPLPLQFLPQATSCAVKLGAYQNHRQDQHSHDFAVDGAFGPRIWKLSLRSPASTLVCRLARCKLYQRVQSVGVVAEASRPSSWSTFSYFLRLTSR